MTRSNVDVLIAGGGFAGLTLAIALRQGLGPSFAVAVADPTLGSSRGDDERASAIVAAVRRLFATIGVWPAIEADAQPILDMVVTDSRLGDAVRPTFLTFAGEIEPGEPFAHMIENRLLVDALAAKAREIGVALQPCAVAEFAREDDRVTASLTDGTDVNARLLVAADGARSNIRTAAGIATHGWNYGQSAIVINVAHERDHQGRAEEHFLPAGPFAILPLKGRRSSIVWTETTRDAERIMA
uniref:FAD-dependent monooxygenase n=1 Tax=Rhodoblastus sp. TaxID=1962975 RepID=UPI003FD89854